MSIYNIYAETDNAGAELLTSALCRKILEDGPKCCSEDYEMKMLERGH